VFSDYAAERKRLNIFENAALPLKHLKTMRMKNDRGSARQLQIFMHERPF
jgi:hypothetical protein